MLGSKYCGCDIFPTWNQQVLAPKLHRYPCFILKKIAFSLPKCYFHFFAQVVTKLRQYSAPILSILFWDAIFHGKYKVDYINYIVDFVNQFLHWNVLHLWMPNHELETVSNAGQGELQLGYLAFSIWVLINCLKLVSFCLKITQTKCFNK